MELEFFLHRNAHRRNDEYSVRHTCVTAGIRSLIRMWYRTEEGTWETYDDQSALDIYCPRCGRPYPQSEDIEEEFQKWLKTQPQ